MRTAFLEKLQSEFSNILEAPIQDFKKVDQMKAELGKYLVKKEVATKEGIADAVTD